MYTFNNENPLGVPPATSSWNAIHEPSPYSALTYQANISPQVPSGASASVSNTPWFNHQPTEAYTEPLASNSSANFQWTGNKYFGSNVHENDFSYF